MANKQEVAVKNAMNDLFVRVLEQVQRMATQLTKQAESGDARLYRTLVENTRQLNSLLRASNVTNDQRLTDLTDRIEKSLCQHDVEVYKTNQTETIKAAKSAVALVKDIEDVMEWY
jgi:Na+/phosphate symporter